MTTGEEMKAAVTIDYEKATKLANLITDYIEPIASDNYQKWKDAAEKMARAYLASQARVKELEAANAWREIKHTDAQNYKEPWDCSPVLIAFRSNIDEGEWHVREARWYIPYDGAAASRGYWVNVRGRDGCVVPEAVTHWRPLPTPPSTHEVG